MRQTLITGANRGLGLEFTRQCLQAGDRVFACCRSPEKAESLLELQAQTPEQVVLVRLDVSDATSIAAAIAEVTSQTAHLDLLINNAGVNSASGVIAEHEKNVRFGSLESGGILKMIQINAISPVLLVQEAVELLKASEDARVINISSWLGSIGGKSRGGNYGYCGSKATFNMLGRAMAFDLKEHGVLSIQFNPGWVQTDMGGSKASLTPEQSVGGILQTMKNATLEDAGCFLQWDGSEHLW